jgi:large conductance mechanosensitive channel
LVRKHGKIQFQSKVLQKTVLSERAKVMSLAKEFKAFAMRGNVLDMAVGIIIGGAFGKIVGSLVNDVIMPPIGLLLGNMDFSQMAIMLKKESIDAAGSTIPAVTIGYGMFINTIINFLIVALAIFMVIKAMNAAKKKEEANLAVPPPPSAEEKILTEIRDILGSK